MPTNHVFNPYVISGVALMFCVRGGGCLLEVTVSRLMVWERSKDKRDVRGMKMKMFRTMQGRARRDLRESPYECRPSLAGGSPREASLNSLFTEELAYKMPGFAIVGKRL